LEFIKNLAIFVNYFLSDFMVNLFSSTPCTISGGGCMCGSFTDGSISEPFYDNSTNLEEDDYFTDATSNRPTKQNSAFDPISSLFSEFYNTPVKQTTINHPATANSASPSAAILHNISTRLGVDPSTLHTLVNQIASQFGINPQELKKNLDNFLSVFSINKTHIRPLIQGVASQIGLNKRMGHPGLIHPNVLKQFLQKSNIPVSANTAAAAVNSVLASVQPNQLLPSQNNANRVSANAARLNGTNIQKQNLLQSIGVNGTQPLVAPNKVEIPVVHSNNGRKEPVVIKANGNISSQSGQSVALDHSGVLKNVVNGTPVTVGNHVVTVNRGNQLVNSKTGNPITVLHGNGPHQNSAVGAVQAVNAQRANAFYTNTVQPVALNAAPIAATNQYTNAATIEQPTPSNVGSNGNPINTRYSYTNYKNIFQPMTEAEYGSLSTYFTKQGVDPTLVNPENLQRRIDDFLSEYGSQAE
jgi:hypothetical protein